MTDDPVDIVVIGAGIHGAGVAQAAAAQGHSVRVLEQTAIAGATSSRSSKLIHGGLRYLETGQFRLVRESLAERALLLRLAPELVRMIPFHVPIYRETGRRPWQLRAGLSLYALFAGAGSGKFSTVARREWAELDGLDTRGLQQVFRYHDAQTDDRALTRAVMASAQALDAELLCPAAFLHAELVDDGCIIDYHAAGRQRQCRARVLVNAAGPWVNDVLTQVSPRPSPQSIERVQGTHLVLDGRLARGVYYMEAPQDRRAVFAIPWRDRILLGTTETRYDGDPAQVVPLAAEQRYLLECFGHYFPAWRDDPQARIVEAFAGLRVLPAGGGPAFTRSRETLLHIDRPTHPRVLTIYGGKLTTYRATAGKVLQRVKQSLPPRTARADTATLPLYPQA